MDKAWGRGHRDARLLHAAAHDDYASFAHQANEYKDAPFAQELVDYSVAKWTKRGVRDDSMVQFAFNQQIEGWLDLEYDRKQPNWNQDKFLSCYHHWGVQFDMAAFCYKKD
jgi:hypothetical protein